MCASQECEIQLEQLEEMIAHLLADALFSFLKRTENVQEDKDARDKV